MQSIVACGNCHTPQGPNGPLVGMELAGGLRFEEPPFSAVAPNITPDKARGIGHWTDAQIVTAIREPRRPDGSLIGPRVGKVADVARSDKLAYGRYLAGPLGHCVECHSAPGAQGAPDLANKFGAGGMVFSGP